MSHTHAHVVLLSCAGAGVLAALNIIGIRESATVSLVMACASFFVNVIVIGIALSTMDGAQWHAVLTRMGTGHDISAYELLVGFASAGLPFLAWRASANSVRRCDFRSATRRGGR